MSCSAGTHRYQWCRRKGSRPQETRPISRRLDYFPTRSSICISDRISRMPYPGVHYRQLCQVGSINIRVVAQDGGGRAKMSEARNMLRRTPPKPATHIHRRKLIRTVDVPLSAGHLLYVWLITYPTGCPSAPPPRGAHN